MSPASSPPLVGADQQGGPALLRAFAGLTWADLAYASAEPPHPFEAEARARGLGFAPFAEAPASPGWADPFDPVDEAPPPTDPRPALGDGASLTPETALGKSIRRPPDIAPSPAAIPVGDTSPSTGRLNPSQGADGSGAGLERALAGPHASREERRDLVSEDAGHLVRGGPPTAEPPPPAPAPGEPPNEPFSNTRPGADPLRRSEKAADAGTSTVAPTMRADVVQSTDGADPTVASVLGHRGDEVAPPPRLKAGAARPRPESDRARPALSVTPPRYGGRGALEPEAAPSCLPGPSPELHAQNVGESFVRSQPFVSPLAQPRQDRSTPDARPSDLDAPRPATWIDERAGSPSIDAEHYAQPPEVDLRAAGAGPRHDDRAPVSVGGGERRAPAVTLADGVDRERTPVATAPALSRSPPPDEPAVRSGAENRAERRSSPSTPPLAADASEVFAAPRHRASSADPAPSASAIPTPDDRRPLPAPEVDATPSALTGAFDHDPPNPARAQPRSRVEVAPVPMKPDVPSLVTPQIGPASPAGPAATRSAVPFPRSSPIRQPAPATAASDLGEPSAMEVRRPFSLDGRRAPRSELAPPSPSLSAPGGELASISRPPQPETSGVPLLGRPSYKSPALARTEHRAGRGAGAGQAFPTPGPDTAGPIRDGVVPRSSPSTAPISDALRPQRSEASKASSSVDDRGPGFHAGELRPSATDAPARNASSAAAPVGTPVRTTASPPSQPPSSQDRAVDVRREGGDRGTGWRTERGEPPSAVPPSVRRYVASAPTNPGGAPEATFGADAEDAREQSELSRAETKGGHRTPDSPSGKKSPSPTAARAAGGTLRTDARAANVSGTAVIAAGAADGARQTSPSPPSSTGATPSRARAVAGADALQPGAARALEASPVDVIGARLPVTTARRSAGRERDELVVTIGRITLVEDRRTPATPARAARTRAPLGLAAYLRRDG